MGPETKFKKTIKQRVVGIALSSARKGGDVAISHRQFLTPRDGQLLYDALESISNTFLTEWMIENKRDASTIANCVIFYKDGKATIYINFPIITKIVAKKAIKKGSPVGKDDLADIVAIQFVGVESIPNCAVIYTFSHGWRRFLYFDFVPILTEKERNDLPDNLEFVDIERLAPLFYSIAIFPELFEIKPEILAMALKLGWFPFVRLLGSRFKKICDGLEYGFSMEEIEDEIVDSFDNASIKQMAESWMSKSLYKKNEVILKEGVNSYISGNFSAAIHILYPRIEGLMGSAFKWTGKWPEQKKLVIGLISTAKENNPNSHLLLENDFAAYLREHFFDSFDVINGKTNLSRNSLSHGVVPNSQLNKKKAFQAILILDQIFFYIKK